MRNVDLIPLISEERIFEVDWKYFLSEWGLVGILLTVSSLSGWSSHNGSWSGHYIGEWKEIEEETDPWLHLHKSQTSQLLGLQIFLLWIPRTSQRVRWKYFFLYFFSIQTISRLNILPEAMYGQQTCDSKTITGLQIGLWKI